MYFTDFDSLLEAMKNTIQYQNIDVLQHGYMVNESYNKLIQELESGNHPVSYLYEQLKDKILDEEIMSRYQIYHDCGKPLCKQDGRFPQHELHSYNQWRILFPEEGIIAELMKMDMLFHVSRGDDICELWNHSLAPSLYFTAWAEIEANASMFGGRDSDSYKIKRKRLIQAAKKLNV